MLIKASKIIGLPVFAINDGRRIDSIEDVIYDPFKNSIEALLIEKGGWFSEARVILFPDLQGIGEDAALITAAAQIKKLSDVSKNIETIAKNDTYLTNTKIITEDGRELGKVSDIYFDVATGKVEEFEVSHGTFGYWKEGKKRVKITDIVTVGKDATIVRIHKKDEPSELNTVDDRKTAIVHTEETLENQIQTESAVKDELPEIQKEEIKDQKPIPEEPAITLREITDDEEETTQHPQEDTLITTAQQTGDTDKEAVEEDPVKDELVNQANRKSQMRSDLIERRKREAVGLYLMKNILSREDKLIAREGEMVTYKLLETAQEVDVLDQVINNVTARIPLAA